MYKLIKKIILSIILWPFLLVMLFIKPLVLIRFGLVDSSRIGHFCFFAGYILKKKSKNKKRCSIDILMLSKDVCNKHLKGVFDAHTLIFGYSRIISYILNFLNAKEMFGRHVIKFPIDDLKLLQEEGALFNISKSEKSNELLKKLSIPLDAKWVCLHNRDSAYLNSAYPEKDWGYHSFRDFDVNTLLSAAEELANRGYYVLRMGAAVAQPMISENPKIIDYASHSARSDFADIFLLGNCEFYLGSDSGIFAASALFNKPFSFVNFPVPEPLYSTYYWNEAPFIFKRLRYKDTGKNLSLREVIEAGLENTSDATIFDKAGVELISNTSEDIKQVAIEITERINGKWISKKEDEELQDKYWDIHNKCLKNTHKNKIKARIGTTFLRENRDLLN
jgi:putative glycosyltransferase (TIGR04372 family)